MAYDPRTGKKLSSGTTQDFSNYKGTFKYDTKTGKKLGNVINAEMLQPQAPMNIKPATLATGAVGMMENLAGMAKSNASQYTQNLQNKADETQAKSENALDQYLRTLASQKGEVQQTQEAYADTVDPIQRELNDINQQILAEQQANRRRIQALEKNPTGMLTEGLNAEIRRVENESLAKQADLAVIQMGIQGRYDSAKEIADRAVAVKMEQQRNYLDALKFNYQENKELFTKAEQRAFEAAQGDRERALDREEADLKTISDMSITALQNGAPTSVAAKMRTAKTVEEAMQLGGRYMMSLSDRIKNSELANLGLSEEESLAATTASEKIMAIDDILANTLGFKLAVGPTALNRMAGAIDLTSGGVGKRQDFIASVEQLTSQETLNALINAKAKGATFGALSEGELLLLRQTASKIGKWAKTDKRGNVIGYRASENDFKDELMKMQRLAKKAYEKSTGLKYSPPSKQSFSVDPITGNIVLDITLSDNEFWGAR